jgi:replicative DNA helicase
MSARQDLPEEPADLYADRQVAQLRVPPHSIEAESSVLGGLLLDAAAWDRIGDLVAEGDFYRNEHRLIFAAVAALALASKPVDVVTVHEHLRAIGKADEAGGLAYLTALSQYTPSAGNLRRYAEIVRERAVLRRLISTADEIATLAFNTQGRTLEAIVDEAERRMLLVGQTAEAVSDDWEDMEAGLVRTLQRIQDEADGTAKPDIIPLGLTALDERLDGGGRPGEVIVIGARPSMGKSALALSIGVHTAKAGEPTAYWSGEMPRAQLHNRAMALEAQIHLSRIKRAERLKDFDWPNITRAVESLRGVSFFVNDTPALNIQRLRSMARRLKRAKGLRVLIVDYLGLMDGMDPKQSRTYQLEEITKGLKQLAKELGVLVLLLVQVNRRAEERTDQMPILSDLRDSGAIEQDADIVLFVHRPIKANPGLGDEWKYYAKVSVAKARDAEPGYLDLMYVGEHTRFMDWPEGQEVPTSLVRTRRGGDL